jgi:hypothetical protein
MKTYATSAAGRRMLLLLLVGALIIWAFALWSFSNTLNVSYNPLQFWPTLSASIEQGLNVGQIVPALLMLVLIVATPLLIWNLLTEWSASYTPDEDGLGYATLGVALHIPWASIAALRSVDDDSDEPLDELVLTGDYAAQIGNPVLRFLHAQAYGRHKLPIYTGIEQRDELLTLIRNRVPVQADGTAGAVV